jgi:hypothetical protein
LRLLRRIVPLLLETTMHTDKPVETVMLAVDDLTTRRDSRAPQSPASTRRRRLRWATVDDGIRGARLDVDRCDTIDTDPAAGIASSLARTVRCSRSALCLCSHASSASPCRRRPTQSQGGVHPHDGGISRSARGSTTLRTASRGSTGGTPRLTLSRRWARG